MLFWNILQYSPKNKFKELSQKAIRVFLQNLGYLSHYFLSLIGANNCVGFFVCLFVCFYRQVHLGS